MNYRGWEDEVPKEIKRDSVWISKAYRLALFAAGLSRHDSTKLVEDKQTISLADQLFRSTGAISADIEEGYSRGTGRDRARFYEYDLGSAREARGWYYKDKGRHVQGKSVVAHRIGLLAEVIKLLLTMIPNQRGGVLKEDPLGYHAEPPTQTLDQSIDAEDLLNVVPLP
jgi:four helix bundle protein